MYGWYLQLLITISVDLAYLVCLLLGTTHFTGSCLYIAAVCEHFDATMQIVQKNIEKYLIEMDPWEYKKTRAKINSQMNEAIRIHGRIYE